MTLMRKLSLGQWALYLALLAGSFEIGRGLARLDRGETLLPAILSPVADFCCSLSTSLSPLLV